MKGGTEELNAIANQYWRYNKMKEIMTNQKEIFPSLDFGKNKTFFVFS
jgi:hypothetical protein